MCPEGPTKESKRSIGTFHKERPIKHIRKVHTNQFHWSLSITTVKFITRNVLKIDKRRHLYCYYQHTCLNMYLKWIASCEPFTMIRKTWYSSVSICRRINNNTRTTNPNSAFSHQLQAVSTCIIGYKFFAEKIATSYKTCWIPFEFLLNSFVACKSKSLVTFLYL